ncbi:Fic/DOC family protein [Pseudomonas putida]
MIDEHHYYSGEYCVQDDPYVYSNGVLINSLDIRETAALNEAEADFASARIIQLQESPLEGDFSLQHLQAFHHFIFQDIYPWAGQLRQVDIGKNDTIFLSHSAIESTFQEVSERLATTRCLADLQGNLSAFSSEAGVVLGEINHIHPFREGNGRTQREFLDVLARRAGFILEWGGVSKLAMRDACIGAQTDPCCMALAKLIRLSAKSL